jgi:hypothetical protein
MASLLGGLAHAGFSATAPEGIEQTMNIPRHRHQVEARVSEGGENLYWTKP